MHITQETDYAVRIVYCLAHSQGRKDARTISEEMGVTLRFSLKILHKLVQSGIVKSYKGSKGGYEIARPANEVNLKQVIEAIEGSYALAKCIDPDYVCQWKADMAPGACSFRREFDRISQCVNRELEKVTFDRL
ncbi:MAG: Rrf2 family transcriptional regulator [Oscillospiraceae bacterium]|nr:Rrf2 family transcriptional regulator [Oscillospiraceae bacterium]